MLKNNVRKEIYRTDKVWHIRQRSIPGSTSMSTLPPDQPCSTLYLRQILMSRYPDHFMSLVDLFATGCLLHLQGERCAGHMLVARTLHTITEPTTKSYGELLLRSLSGNEVHFMRGIEPSAELRELCERRQPARFTEAACAR